MTTEPQTFEVTLFEKAEHWTFEVKVTSTAQTYEELYAVIRRDYPKKDYSIRAVFPPIT